MIGVPHASKSLTVLGVVMTFALLSGSSASNAQPPADLSLETVTTIASNRPVAVRNAGDGSNRLFIVQQSGLIWIYDLNTETLLSNPFLDIESMVDDNGNEQGLLGLAFHPNFSQNGFYYVNFTRDPGAGLDRTVVMRFTASGNTTNTATALTLLEVAQDFSNHNGGDIHFGPSDGYLYIGMGDGGSGDDPNDRAQDPVQLLGKMLRIDVDGAQENFQMPAHQELAEFGVIDNCGLVSNYSIPPSNPYISDNNTCDEIWAMGVRNPWRFSFDRVTHDLLIGDVGQGQEEEVDFQPAASSGGENYGWDCREGSIFHESCSNPPVFTEPIISYSRSEEPGTCSITGGFVYRGSIPGLVGYYVYTDICSGQIWFATQSESWTPTEWSTSLGGIYSFGEDEAGELYVAVSGGTVRRFSSASSAFVFDDGFESGDTMAWDLAVP